MADPLFGDPMENFSSANTAQLLFSSLSTALNVLVAGR
jgi:hypothetical protein